MRFLGNNRVGNPNTLAGIFLLIMLAVFAGPSVLPQLIRNTLSVIDASEGPACASLRTGEDRAIHQSLLGRASSQRIQPPISLDVRTGPLPPDPTGNFVITVVITNETIGTIPILVTDDQLILDPNNGLNGIGVVFNNPTGIIANGTEGVNSYAEDRVHLLGPRQLCVHRVTLPLNQVPGFSALIDQNATVKAFYRNNARGTAIAAPGQTPIFSDQGLWVGVVESQPQRIATAN